MQCRTICTINKSKFYLKQIKIIKILKYVSEYERENESEWEREEKKRERKRENE